jgi:hypothetical protein
MGFGEYFRAGKEKKKERERKSSATCKVSLQRKMKWR